LAATVHRVLVVEDEVAVGRALARWLTREGAEVLVLNDSALVEGALRHQAPTIVICDFLMPGRDGVEVLQLVKTLAPLARRCLLSGSLFLVTAQQRESVEPCLFVEKPWSAARFRQQLGFAA
jgi:DNA-binding NtrC family response regulator